MIKLPRTALTVSAAAALLLAGGPAWSAEPKVETKVATRVTFSTPVALPPAPGKPGFQDIFLWSGLEKFKDSGPGSQDDRLKAQCFGAPADDAALGAILSFFIGPVVSLLTDKLKSDIDDELKKYKAETKASEQTQFYDANGKPTWRCFRVTRITTIKTAATKVTKETVKRTLDFDFIGQVAVVGEDSKVSNVGAGLKDAHGMKIRPLRVYVGKPAAKGSQIGMSASVAFDAVWREGAVGKQATLFTTPLFEHKFKRAADDTWTKTPYYFPAIDQDGIKDFTKFPPLASVPLVPLVPISSTAGGSYVTVTPTFTEVGDGDGKATLTLISKLLGKTQDDLNTAITKAAKKVVDPEDPTPPAKPDLFCGTITPNDAGGGQIQWTKTDADKCPGT